jgi:hypothetical protein
VLSVSGVLTGAVQQLVTLFEQPEAADCIFECLTAAGQGVLAGRQQLVNLLSELQPRSQE